MNVLHITPHLGGGVGRVLLAWLRKDKSSTHTVFCLDYANKKAIEASRETGFRLYGNTHVWPPMINNYIEKADIVLIHWWNHPLLYDFLIRRSLPPARVVMWSHVSGFYPPNVFTDALLKYPDIFVFTTPMSENTLEAKRASGDLRVIWSTAGTDHVKDVRPKPHKGFIVGYIGTVDYCKMHPDFLKMSMSVKVPGVHFIVCGGPNDEQMREEAERLGVGDKFTFTGPVDDIAPYLSEFDVFGYPLNPMHYGTCDQSLAEAMAAGVPPVTLGNPMERYMVDAHGYVVEEENYAAAIELLHLNPFLRRDLSGYLREAAAQRFSLDAMIEQWQHVFEDLMKKPKSERKWSGRVSGEGVSPSEVFIESLGDHVDDFRANLKGTPSFNWKSKTRGTAHQYSSFSPQDKILREWSDSMEVA